MVFNFHFLIWCLHLPQKENITFGVLVPEVHQSLSFYDSEHHDSSFGRQFSSVILHWPFACCKVSNCNSEARLLELPGCHQISDSVGFPKLSIGCHLRVIFVSQQPEVL